MNPRNPIPIESRALGTLAYIRASIDAAGSLMVPGHAGIVMGSVGIVAATLASFSPFADDWLRLWIVAAVFAGVPGGVLMARQIARRGNATLSAPVRKFLLCLCPALLAGVLLTAVLLQAGIQHAVPGTWLLLYGCGVTAASTATNPRSQAIIAAMGAAFIALGILAFVLPASIHNLLLGTGFGAIHIVSGILIRRSNHDD